MSLLLLCHVAVGRTAVINLALIYAGLYGVFRQFGKIVSTFYGFGYSYPVRNGFQRGFSLDLVQTHAKVTGSSFFGVSLVGQNENRTHIAGSAGGGAVFIPFVYQGAVVCNANIVIA